MHLPARKLINNAPTQHPACSKETTSPFIVASVAGSPSMPKYAGKVGIAKTPEITPT